MLKLTDDFKKAVKERKLLPIIGAGFSKNISPTFPDWSQVMDIAANILGYNPNILKMYGDYLQIAEYLFLQDNLDKLKNELVLKFGNPSFKVIDSRPHLLFPYLDVEAIYTTNWDSWIEKGFENEALAYRKIAAIQHFNEPNTFIGGKDRINCLFNERQLKKIKKKFQYPKIIKLHGDFDFHDTFVLKETDYFERLSFEDPLDISFRADILGKAMLFIGYSFNDINIRYLWHRFTKQFSSTSNSCESYFISFQENPILKKLLESQNISIINLNSSNKQDSLIHFFKEVIKIQEL